MMKNESGDRFKVFALNVESLGAGAPLDEKMIGAAMPTKRENRF